jgi:hypothetical protein
MISNNGIVVGTSVVAFPSLGRRVFSPTVVSESFLIAF